MRLWNPLEGKKCRGPRRRDAAWLGRRAARTIPLLLLVLLPARTAQAAPACTDSGAETWDTFEDYHALGQEKKTDLLLEGAVRTDCGFSDIQLNYRKAKAGFSFQPLKHLEIRPYYFLVVKEPGTKRTQGLSVEIIADDIPLGRRLLLEEKNRFEEDFRPTGKTTRYANMIQLFRPVRVGDVYLKPYAKGQAKYDLRYLGWVYTQLYFGVQKPLARRKLILDGYYVRQFGSHLSPGSFNGIGMTVRTYF